MKKLFSGKLWSHRDFLKLWGGLSVSLVGSEISNMALPTIAILTLGAGAREIGLLRALETLAFPVLGIVAGVWADRGNSRRIMIWADVARFLAILSVPVAAFFGFLSIYQLYVVALVTGVFTVLFNVSYMTYMPMLVGREDLREGNSKVTLSQSTASVLGPAFTGWLVHLVGAARAVTIDAFSYLVSGIALWRISTRLPPRQRADNDRAGFWSDAKEGTRFVFTQPVLRQLMIVTGVYNLGFSMVQAVLMVFAYKGLNLSPGQVGLILSIGSTGLILGSLFASRVVKVFGLGWTLFLTASTLGLSLASLALSSLGFPMLVLGVLWFIASITMPIYDINQVTLRQTLTPDALQGRMNATMRTVIWGALPIGSTLGGLIASEVGPAIALVVGGGVITAGALLVFAGPLIRLTEQPTSAALEQAVE